MCKNASDISCILAQRQYIPGYGVLTVSFWLKPFKKSIYMCKNASEISCILAQRLYKSIKNIPLKDVALLMTDLHRLCLLGATKTTYNCFVNVYLYLYLNTFKSTWILLKYFS